MQNETISSGLYPSLDILAGPTPETKPIVHPDVSVSANTFRLQKINEVKLFFQKEIEERRKTLNKYKKCIKVNEGIEATSTIASVAVGVTGVVLLASVIAGPIGLLLEVISLGCGGLSILPYSVNKILHPKLEKHQKIITLAISKLNTINDLVSKAIDDGVIDQNEFKLILNEHEHYIELKNTLRKRDKMGLSINVEDLKNDFLEKGKQLGKLEAREEIRQKLAIT